MKHYTHISAPAYGEQDGVVMEQDCFLVEKPVEPASVEIGDPKCFGLLSQPSLVRETTD